jgi:DNA-binding transcriptional regulator YhcF (GntR family)
MQIVDFCFRRILIGQWKANERIPSVRELGMTLQVNPNTAMRAFEYIQSERIIYLKRGEGYYVDSEARNRILKLQKKDFFDDTLPELFQAMNLLGIGVEEILEKYNEQKKNSL